MSARTITSVDVLDIQRRPLPSKHYVYVMTVTWSDGSVLTIYRRYSLFYEFHTALLDMFPEASGEAKGSVRSIPFLPGKKLFERTNTRKHALQRKGALQDYINALLKLPPQISACAHAKTFFSINDEDISPPTEEQLQQRAPNVLDKATRLMGVGGAEEEPAEEKAMNVSTPMVLDQYRVLANYKKTGRSEVDVKEGDIVEVVEKNTNGWWFINIDDAQGWLPATYLEPLDALDPQEKPVLSPQGINYVSIQEYKSKESDEISFEKGVVVFVLETNLDGWWRVKYRDKEGWAPATCLKILPSGVTPAAAIAQAEAGRERAGTNVTKAHPPRSTTDHTGDRPMTRARDERGRLTASIIVADTIANRLAIAPAAATSRGKAAQPTPAAAAVAPPAIPEDAPSKPGRPAAAVRAATLVTKDAPARPTDRKLSTSEEGGKADKKAEAAVASAKAEDKASSAPDKAAASGEEFVLLQDFKSDDGALRLRIGDRVKLLERGDGGWAFVRAANGAEGWAPEDFLEKANGKSTPAATTAKKSTPTPTPASSALASKVSSPTPVSVPVAVTPSQPTPVSAPAPAPAAAIRLPTMGAANALKKPSDVKQPIAVPTSAATPSPAPAPTPVPTPTPTPTSAASAMRLPAMSVSTALRPPVASANAPPLAEKPRPAAKSISAARSGGSGAIASAGAVAGAGAGAGGPSNTQEGGYVVTESYAKEDETGLSVTTGERLVLVEQTDSGWWFMRNGSGAEGWVPSTFVTKASASPVKAALSTPTSAAAATTNGASGPAKAPVVAAKASIPTPAPAPTPTPTPLVKAAMVPPVAAKSSNTATPVVSKAPVTVPRPAVAQKKNLFKVIDAYTAEDADSLSLVVGERVEVVEKTDSGWWFARNAAGKEGWVPSTYLVE